MNTKNILTAAVMLIVFAACNTKEMDLLPEANILTVRIEQDDTRVSVSDTDGKFSWDTGDKIAVYIGSAFVEKEVTSAGAGSPIGTISGSDYDPSEDNSRDYFAIYPSSAKNDSYYGNPSLKIMLPAEYNIIGKDADYTPLPMIAVNNSGSSLLEFRHVCGLLRITLTGVVASTKTVRVTFDKDVTGAFIVTDAGTVTPGIYTTGTATDRNVVTFTVADATTTVSPTTPIVLNIPLPCSTYNRVMVSTVNGSGITLSNQIYEDLGFVFSRKHGKHITYEKLAFDFAISNPVEDIARNGDSVMYDFAETVDVTVHKISEATITAAPWKAYFSATDAQLGDPVSGSWSTDPLKDAAGNDWLALSAYSGDGNANAVQVRLTGAPFTTLPTRTPSSDAAAEITELQSGSAVSNIDLSRVDILKGPYEELDPESKAETANTYVIKKYGEYNIPCVYGSALQKGTYVSSAYSTSVAGNVLSTFVNADGKAIGDPVIPRDDNLTKSANLVARVVWQDTQPGCEILTDEDVQYYSSNSTAAICPYIKVNFKKERIAPGNVVVALYDQDYGKILWSWHLWVTSQTLDCTQLKRSNKRLDPLDPPSTDPDPYAAERMTNYFLNVNLGWTPPISYSGASTAARSQYVIIVCTTNNRVVDSFKVSQDAYNLPAVSAEAYSSTYYQWGRKDPFLPSSGTENTNKAISHAGDFLAIDRTADHLATTQEGSSATARLATMIKFPYKFFADANNYPGYLNLWNSDLAVASGVHMAVTKTVYDPAPRRFHLQRRYDFTCFVSDGGYWPMYEDKVFGEWQDVSGLLPAGMMLSKDHSADPDTWVFYIPAAGYRDDEGVIDRVMTNGNIWSSVPQFEAQAFYLDFGPWGVNCQANSSFRAYGFSARPVKYDD